jgi:hypothetical protein
MVNGEFMTDVDTYINDQFILRDSWIAVQSTLEYGIGKRENNGVFIGDNALLSKIDLPDEKYVSQNISGIDYFASLTDIPVSVMIIPNSAEIQTYKLPRYAPVWSQKDEIEEIYGRIKASANSTRVNCISAYEILDEHKYDYIYYRTDHHWTTYGAYLAYTQYCAANGLDAAEYTADKISDSFNGTLYSNSRVRFVQSDSMEAFNCGFTAKCDVLEKIDTVKSYDSMYFTEYLGKKDKYAYFLGPNEPVVMIYGENKDAPSLIMFKDSYSHCMAPMLLENYSRITLVDLRYIQSYFNQYFNIYDYDQALFLCGIDTFVNQNDISKLCLYKATEPQK